MAEPLTVDQLEEQLRFFKAAYGITTSSAPETYQAGLRVLDACHDISEPLHNDAQRLLRASIEMTRKFEVEQRRANKLHELVIKLTEGVAHALDNYAASTVNQPPPGWLFALATELDLILADSAFENRRS